MKYQMLYSNWQWHHVNVVRTCLFAVCLVQLATYQKIEEEQMHHFMRHKLSRLLAAAKVKFSMALSQNSKLNCWIQGSVIYYSNTYWLRDGKVMKKASGCLFFQPTLYEHFLILASISPITYLVHCYSQKRKKGSLVQ